MPHTLAQKILLAHTETDRVFPSEIVMVRCDVVMTNDISGPMAFKAMERMGVEKVFDFGAALPGFDVMPVARESAAYLAGRGIFKSHQHYFRHRYSPFL